MAIRGCCDHCGKPYLASEKLEGKMVICKSCGEKKVVTDTFPVMLDLNGSPYEETVLAALGEEDSCISLLLGTIQRAEIQGEKAAAHASGRALWTELRLPGDPAVGAWEFPSLPALNDLICLTNRGVLFIRITPKGVATSHTLVPYVNVLRMIIKKGFYSHTLEMTVRDGHGFEFSLPKNIPDSPNSLERIDQFNLAYGNARRCLS